MSGATAILKSGATLAIIATICTALVAATYTQTADRIAANEKTLLEQSLQPALANTFYDSSVSESRLVLDPPHGLPGTEAAIIYRVYSGDEPVAALFVVTARDGFAGPIRILLGVNIDGIVTGVRILQHRETPGFGDKIDARKSDWVHQFASRSLQDPPVARWKIQSDGGEFDQLTGASVTPRAVIKAIHETLLYFEAHRDNIFAATATDEES